MRTLSNVPQFDSSNRFDALRMATDDNDKELDKQIKMKLIHILQDQSIQKLKLKPQHQLSLKF